MYRVTSYKKDMRDIYGIPHNHKYQGMMYEKGFDVANTKEPTQKNQKREIDKIDGYYECRGG